MIDPAFTATTTWRRRAIAVVLVVLVVVAFIGTAAHGDRAFVLRTVFDDPSRTPVVVTITNDNGTAAALPSNVTIEPTDASLTPIDASKDCLDQRAVGTFLPTQPLVGIARCTRTETRLDLLAPFITAAEAAQFLFGHCAAEGDIPLLRKRSDDVLRHPPEACAPFYFPEGIEVLKAMKPKLLEQFKTKPVVWDAVQMIRAAPHISQRLTPHFVPPLFKWGQAEAGFTPNQTSRSVALVGPPWLPPSELVRVPEYDVAVWLPTMMTCMNNLYHGTFEVLLPVWQLMGAFHALQPKASMRVLVLVQVSPSTDMMWGPRNRRCPVLSIAPYGLGPPAATAPMLEGMRRMVSRLDVVAMNEDYKLWKVDSAYRRQAMNASYSAKHMIRGVPTGCFAFPGSSEEPLTVGHEEYPYYRRKPQCDAHLRSFSKAVLVAHGVGDGDDAPVSAAEAACPRVLLLVRVRGAALRAFMNQAQVVAALQRALKGCGSVVAVKLEAMPFKKQLRELRKATILVGARGAGLVMGIFLRRGAGVLSFAGYRPRVPMLFDDASQPYVPWGFVREDLHVTAGLCPVAPPSDLGEVRLDLCLHHTGNMCYIDCGQEYVYTQMMSLLKRIRAGAEGRSKVLKGASTTNDGSLPSLLTSHHVPWVDRDAVSLKGAASSREQAFKAIRYTGKQTLRAEVTWAFSGALTHVVVVNMSIASRSIDCATDTAQDSVAGTTEPYVRLTVPYERRMWALARHPRQQWIKIQFPPDYLDTWARMAKPPGG